MKPVNRILLAFGAVALAFASCEEIVEREIAPKETSGVYFLETNVTSHTFLPDSTVAFDVLVGRVNADKQETVKYTVEDEYGVFVLPDSIVFEKGVTVDTIHVTAPNMTLGMNAELSLAMDMENVSIYGTASVTISVLRDYEWINRGTATFTDPFGLGAASCSVQQAKGTNLFCLRDPYKGLESVLQDYMGSDWTMPTGYSLQFTMDTTNWALEYLPQVQDIGVSAFSEIVLGIAGLTILYEEAQLGCYHESNGNQYTIVAYLYDGNYYYTPEIYISFVWDEANFPNPDLIIDPAEGDGKLELDLELSAGMGAWYGNLGNTDKYGRPLFSNYYLVLCDSIYNDSFAGNQMILDIYATPSEGPASFEGEYTIGSSMEAGNVLAGYKSASGIMGSYIYYAPTKTVLYLSEGTVTVKDETDGSTSIRVAAQNLTGDTINISYKGELQIMDATQTRNMDTKNKSEFVSSFHAASLPTVRKPVINLKPAANIKF